MQYFSTLFTIVCLSLSINYANATTRYVKQGGSGSGDGSSWVNASSDLQAMINASILLDEVWVAEGTYKPNTYPLGCLNCTSPRDYTFHLKNEVKVYGGFPDTGSPVFSDRNVSSHPTILSGNIDESGTEDAYHVILSITDDNTTVLDGFTVTGGHADGVFEITVEGQSIYKDVGGGMWISNFSSPSLINCTFSGNNVNNAGGGIYNAKSSNPVLTNCLFSNNIALNGSGMHNEENSNPILTNCNFEFNIASNNGGGIHNESSNPSFTDCTFSGNTAIIGGGIFNSFNSSPIFINCIFSNNSSSSGGGMYSDDCNSLILTNCTFSSNNAVIGGGMYNGSSNPILTNCIFNSNSATEPTFYGGGGMYNIGSNLNLTNCTFSSNTSPRGGGIHSFGGNSILSNCTFTDNTSTIFGAGMFNNGSNSILTNCNFSGNTAGNLGGGMFNTQICTSNLINCTFSNNQATNVTGRGAGVYISSVPKVTLTNCILWNNTTPNNPDDDNSEEIHSTNTTASDVTVNYSIVRDATGSPLTVNNAILNNCLNSDPLFVNADNPAGADNIHRTEDDGLYLQAGSPAINTGTTVDSPLTDIIGYFRDALPDMGAYEYNGINSAPVSVNIAVAHPLTAYPNPTDAGTTITFTAQTAQMMTLTVYAVDGRKVAALFNKTTEPNMVYELKFDMLPLPVGTYYTVLRSADGNTQQVRLLLIK